jgi:superfamily II DNA or RNA helicase
MTGFETGQMIRLPGEPSWVRVDMAMQGPDGSWNLMVTFDDTSYRKINLALGEEERVETVAMDGEGDSSSVLAGMWSSWMAAAATDSRSAALASTSLKPLPHQHFAVYGTMLPQPTLRFLLGDEPGTGKTIMGGLLARECERLGTVSRCLVVAPAHLVSKWISEFDRFFGGGLRRIENKTIKDKTFEYGLKAGQGFWIVSLELAAVNGAVQDAIDPARAGWDLVIVDEAHRLTPNAEAQFAVGRILKEAPNFVAMTATPHRGNEFYFRALMHLVDPAIYPMPSKDDEHATPLTPSRLHLLRRMKEELTDYDGQAALFRKRTAANIRVPLAHATEKIVYEEALNLVDTFFPDNARILGRLVYGKRAASCLFALRETLRRRHDLMGTKVEIEARRDEDLGDPYGEDVAAGDHAAVIFEGSKNAREEKARIRDLLGQLDAFLDTGDPSGQSSKWPKTLADCLHANGIAAGTDEQAVIFTEYADTADWLVGAFRAAGYTAERYSGRDDHAARDRVRTDFMAGKFQIIVSTDAGNEGIDLQSAHVLVNWDIPWSLVTLEQRMGRIHRVGQNRDVLLYNVIAVDTLEGETYAKLLDRLVNAANEMGGKMFDSLSLIASKIMAVRGDAADVPLIDLFSSDPARQAAARQAIGAISEEQLRIEARNAEAQAGHLNTAFDHDSLQRAVEDIHTGELERINPHIVERFLQRLASAGLVRVRPSAVADSGIFTLDSAGGFTLPASLAVDKPQLVATFGDAKNDAIRSGAPAADRAVDLGPGTVPFRELIDASMNRLAPAMHQGGRLQDPTTVTGYHLFLYETEVTVGPRSTAWRHLLRVDNDARAVPFELLANLEPVDGGAASTPPPAVSHNAEAAADAAVATQAAAKREAFRLWQESAHKQLQKLADKMVADLPADQRQAARTRIRAATKERLDRLAAVASIQVGSPRLVGWARVDAAGIPAHPQEADSELIATSHIVKLLRAANWAVDDVSQERKGYDLVARKGHLMRAVEVKGVWQSAASTGVRLTGGELTKAGIIGDDYWLYVVDQCHDGTGTLFAAYKNPARTFHDLARDVAIVAIKGSDLLAHQTTDNAT